jgi:peptidyl-prolyl cis-trans isomerase A (cyclophilin A)
LLVVPLACAPAAENPDPPPAIFKVRFETTKGDFVVGVNRTWSPHGADRFYELVRSGFYDDCAFFRVLRNQIVQFGISGDPAAARKWSRRTIPDDPSAQSNRRATIAFAKTEAPNSRTTQLFINLADNAEYDAQGFTPFGKVIEGMEVVDSINAEYREEPMQSRIEDEGNAYLRRVFPRLDYVKKATVVEQ